MSDAKKWEPFVVLSNAEAAQRRGAAAPDASEAVDAYDYRRTLYEQNEAGELVRVVGTDGGEPEDQSFWRDWSWVAPALNAERARAAPTPHPLDQACEQIRAAAVQHALQHGAGKFSLFVYPDGSVEMYLDDPIDVRFESAHAVGAGGVQLPSAALAALVKP